MEEDLLNTERGDKDYCCHLVKKKKTNIWLR